MGAFVTQAGTDLRLKHHEPRLTPSRLMRLQSLAGNAAVAQLIAERCQSVSARLLKDSYPPRLGVWPLAAAPQELTRLEVGQRGWTERPRVFWDEPNGRKSVSLSPVRGSQPSIHLQRQPISGQSGGQVLPTTIPTTIPDVTVVVATRSNALPRRRPQPHDGSPLPAHAGARASLVPPTPREGGDQRGVASQVALGPQVNWWNWTADSTHSLMSRAFQVGDRGVQVQGFLVFSGAFLGPGPLSGFGPLPGNAHLPPLTFFRDPAFGAAYIYAPGGSSFLPPSGMPAEHHLQVIGQVNLIDYQPWTWLELALQGAVPIDVNLGQGSISLGMQAGAGVTLHPSQRVAFALQFLGTIAHDFSSGQWTLSLGGGAFVQLQFGPAAQRSPLRTPGERSGSYARSSAESAGRL